MWRCCVPWGFRPDKCWGVVAVFCARKLGRCWFQIPLTDICLFHGKQSFELRALSIAWMRDKTHPTAWMGYHSVKTPFGALFFFRCNRSVRPSVVYASTVDKTYVPFKIYMQLKHVQITLHRQIMEVLDVS